MIITAYPQSPEESKNTVVRLRCPACKQRGAFEVLLNHDLKIQKAQNSYIIAGLSRCPDPSCKALVFFALDKLPQQLLVSYPTEHIDFDTTDIPPTVVSAFEETIVCHANRCYVAAAIMVRKTLEELCRERATGTNLKKRLEELRGKVVLPQELLDGLHDLRLLGNDAAHIESHEYDKVGQEEVEIAIEITKEVLKAVYQYSSLIGRLQKLKKPVTS